MKYSDLTMREWCLDFGFTRTIVQIDQKNLKLLLPKNKYVDSFKQYLENSTFTNGYGFLWAFVEKDDSGKVRKCSIESDAIKKHIRKINKTDVLEEVKRKSLEKQWICLINQCSRKLKRIIEDEYGKQKWEK